MQVRPEDLRALATERYRHHRPPLRRRQAIRVTLDSIWRRIEEAWNIRPRPRLTG